MVKPQGIIQVQVESALNMIMQSERTAFQAIATANLKPSADGTLTFHFAAKW